MHELLAQIGRRAAGTGGQGGHVPPKVSQSEEGKVARLLLMASLHFLCPQYFLASVDPADTHFPSSLKESIQTNKQTRFHNFKLQNQHF